MRRMPKLFGMITTQASSKYTVVALDSFFQHTPMESDDAFLLIDNDGGWKDPARSPREGRRFDVLVNPQPRSFAENANRVIQSANSLGADAYLLNNDIVFTPDWLSPVSTDLPAVMTPTCNQNFGYRRGKLELKPVMTLADFEAGSGGYRGYWLSTGQRTPRLSRRIRPISFA